MVNFQIVNSEFKMVNLKMVNARPPGKRYSVPWQLSVECCYKNTAEKATLVLKMRHKIGLLR